MRQVQEKKLERSVQLCKERILRKKIRNGHTPSNTAVNEEEEEQMEQMAKVEEVQEVEEKLEKAEEELIITPYPSAGPFNRVKLIVLCMFCSPKRAFVGNTKYTSNLHRHVRNCHPELLQKIKDRKNEQSLERRAQRNERRRKSQRNAVEDDEEDEVELEE
ncbi:hypothetical protein ACLKA6_007674 [Drosophila palustris]